MFKKMVLLGMFVSCCQISLAGAASIESKVEQNGTAKYLEISGLSARQSNNMLVVNAEVTNKDNSDQQGFYRVRWLDESGDPVWNDEPWKPMLLHGNQKVHLQLLAPTMKAKDFKIEFSATQNWRAN